MSARVERLAQWSEERLFERTMEEIESERRERMRLSDEMHAELYQLRVALGDRYEGALDAYRRRDRYVEDLREFAEELRRHLNDH